MFKHASKKWQFSTTTRSTESKTGYKTAPIYDRWKRMVEICYNEKCPQYKIYGAIGYTVCNKWRYDFDAFAEWSFSVGFNNMQSDIHLKIIDDSKIFSPTTCRYTGSGVTPMEILAR